MKLYFIILGLFLISCSKQPENIEAKTHCETCIELSDKYNSLDTSFIRTDTLFSRRLCDSTLEVFKANANSMEFKICGTNLLEKRRYIYQP